MYRILFAVFRLPALDRAAFLEHYLQHHTGIARRFPGLRGYEIFPLPATHADQAGPDAFAVMSFDSEADFGRAVASPEWAEALRDNERFVERFEFHVVDHLRVV